MTAEIPKTFSPCCNNAECPGFQLILDTLRTWGLSTELSGRGTKRHFEIDVPDYWGKNRCARFAIALDKLSDLSQHRHDSQSP